MDKNLKYSGYAYLDKNGVFHLLEENGTHRTTLPEKVRQGYYRINLRMEPLSTNESKTALDVFSLAKKG